MPTLAESAVEAAAALNRATAQWLAFLDQIKAENAAQKTEITTFVNIATAPSRTWVVDPINGNDVTGDGTAAKPVKSLDFVLSQATPATRQFVLLIGNDVIRRRHQLSGVVQVSGVQLTPGQANPWVGSLRQIAFQGEAANSPVAFSGRTTAGVDLFNGNLIMDQVALAIADVPAGLDTVAHIIGSGSSSIVLQGAITGTTPGNIGRLFKNGDISPLDVRYSGSIPAGVSGRVFAGVAAGANPNTGDAYRTNITAA